MADASERVPGRDATTGAVTADPERPVPTVLAIVVNHERPAETERCVRSLLASDHPRLEVAIVDNGSRDESVPSLARAFPGLAVLETGANRGYAAALNRGVEHGERIGADHLWFLNNDLVVAPDALSEALRAGASVARPGLIASTQLIPRHRGSTDPFDGLPYPCATVRGRLRDRHIACDGTCAGPGVHRADVVTGAALLVSAEVVRALGPLDERFFHYGEEDDYSERARAAGFSNLLACRSHVSHDLGVTLANADPQAEYYRLRNLFMLRRRVDGWNALSLMLRPGYAKAIATTWARLRSDERSRLAFRSGLRHGVDGRGGRVSIPGPAAVRPLRLMVVTHSAGEYGAERSLLAMLADLPRAEVQPLVVLPRPGPLSSRLEAAGVASLIVANRAWRGRRTGLLPIFVRFWSTAAAVWRLDRIIRTAGIDVVATWTLGVTAGAFAARVAGRPHVWYAHELIEGNASMHGPLPARVWLRMVERLSDAVVSVSSATRGQFGPAGGTRHVVIPNAIAVDRPAPSRERSERARVAVIGAVAPHKRTVDAVRAFDVLRRSHPGADLHVWGDGPAQYRRLVEAEADRLGLDGTVTLEGFEADPAVYLDADIVLAPSYPEAFGLAVLEAMAMGIPVVAAHSDGLAELVGADGAVLVAPGDWQALGSEAARILDDEERYRAVSEAGRRRAATFRPTGSSPHAELLIETARRSRDPARAEGRS